MKYLLLIQKDEAKYRALTDEARAALHRRYMGAGMKMADAGIMRSGAMLELTDTATTVRVRDGKRLITDGPFAETAEQIAGIMVIEVQNLDEAIDWAATHPDVEWASIEIRPIVPFEPPR